MLFFLDETVLWVDINFSEYITNILTLNNKKETNKNNQNKQNTKQNKQN